MIADRSAVMLVGRAVDPEDGTLEGDALVWTSSADGDLGTGPSITVALSIGAHTLTLVARDSQGKLGSNQVDVTVLGENQPPMAFITTPATGAVFVEGDAVTFEGGANDPEDGALSGSSLIWSSSIDGSMGLGNRVSLTRPSLGVHTILLTAIDSKGLEAFTSITVEIAPVGTNLPPRVTVTAPASNASFIAGDAVVFTGTAIDPEDGSLIDSSLGWKSSVDGALGTGVTVTRSDLSLGVHTVTLTATDSQGRSASDQVVISVNQPGNTPPMAQITAPASGSTVFSNATVVFEGTATDVEDGTLSGASLAWISTIDAALGTGPRLEVMGLTPGAHTITLVATDSGAGTGTAQVTLTVLAPNTAPTVAITSPSSGSRFTAGDAIQFVGMGTDAEDGALSGSSLIWQSSIDGSMGTGSPLAFSSLTQGTHTITLTAVDSGGLPASANISVTIDPAQVNLPPVAQLVAPMTGATGASLSFDASSSRDSDGTITDYRFDFGDGTAALTGVAATVNHAFAQAGTYTVTLTVTDNDNATATDSGMVVITDAVPVPEVAVDVSDSLGGNCQIELDGAERPHVIYRNEDHRQLWYAAFDGMSWTTSLVDGPGFDQGALVDDTFALAVSAAGVPHIAYRDTVTNQVRYATPNGAAWIREQVSDMYPDAVSQQMAIALDPANGGRPTIAWTYRPGTPEGPAVAFRASAGSWTESYHAAASTNDYFLGGFAFDASGVAYLSFDSSYLGYVKWSAALDFHDVTRVEPAVTGSFATPLLLDGAGQPILMTAESTHHEVGGAWITTAYEYGASTLFDGAVGPNGDFRIGLLRRGMVELAMPTPFWMYEYQGPMDNVALSIAVDSTPRIRACFFRSGNLIVY